MVAGYINKAFYIQEQLCAATEEFLVVFVVVILLLLSWSKQSASTTHKHPVFSLWHGVFLLLLLNLHLFNLALVLTTPHLILQLGIGAYLPFDCTTWQ